jgi:SAM-dependent methyltransferase
MGKYRPSASKENFEMVARFNAKLLPENAKGAVLDIGAYKGLMEKFLPKTLTYSGVDLHGWDNPRITAMDLNVGELPFPDQEFDYVFATNVIEHLKLHPKIILAEIKRVCKPGGTVIISLPNDKGLASLLLPQPKGLFRIFADMPSLDTQEFGHYWAFDNKLSRNTVSQFFDIKKELFNNGILLSRIPLLRSLKGLCSDFYMICENND